jgi:hypothetical protein
MASSKQRAWNFVSNLPMEQSLILGGGGTLAFFELLGYAQGFLQTNTKKIFDLLWPSTTTSVKAVANNAIYPLIAREGVVGGMLLTKNGIFYLRGENLVLYGASAYFENQNTDFATHAFSELSPHAFALYQKATHNPNDIQQNLEFHFRELLDDCLLQMILNDFQLILSEISDISSPDDKNKLSGIILSLIKKITLTKDAEPPPTYAARLSSYFWSPALNINEAGHKSSQACLTEWAHENRADLINDLKPQLQKFIQNHQIFFKPQQAPLAASFTKTMCSWNKTISNTLTISLKLFPQSTLDGTWSQVGKLQYSISDP